MYIVNLVTDRDLDPDEWDNIPLVIESKLKEAFHSDYLIQVKEVGNPKNRPKGWGI